MNQGMTVISMYNQAGGSGKTSVTRDVGYALNTRGHRVLLIDADQQASLTRWMGLFQRPEGMQGQPSSMSARSTIKDVLEGTEECLPTPHEAHGVSIIPSNGHLKNVELLLGSNLDLIGGLRRSIQAAKGKYDFVLIDTPPADNALVLACIAASDFMVMPINGSKGLDNIDNVSKVIRRARDFNPGVQFGMFVMNSFTKNLLHDMEVYDALQNVYRGLGPTATPITNRPSVFKDAPNAMQPVALYRPKNEAVQEVNRVTDELLAMIAARAQVKAALQ